MTKTIRLHKTRLVLSAIATSSLLLAACGGGGGWDNTPSSSSSSNGSSTATDLADGNVSGGVKTITSFASDTSSFFVSDSSWTAQPSYGTIARVSSNATNGSYSMSVVKSASSSADIMVTKDIGDQDWTAYRYLKVDVTNTAASTTFWTQLAISSGPGWASACYELGGNSGGQGNSPTTDANGKVTLVFDLNRCDNTSGAGFNIDKAHIQRILLLQQSWTGTNYYDNIRLTN